MFFNVVFAFFKPVLYVIQNIIRAVALIILKILKFILPKYIFDRLIPQELLDILGDRSSAKPPKPNSPSGVMQIIENVVRGIVVTVLRILGFILPAKVISLLPDALLSLLKNTSNPNTSSESSNEIPDKSNDISGDEPPPSEVPPPSSDLLFSILQLKQKAIRVLVVSVLKTLKFIIPKKIFWGLLPDELVPLLQDADPPKDYPTVPTTVRPPATEPPSSEESVSIGKKSH